MKLLFLESKQEGGSKSTEMIEFILLVNKQGQTRVSKYYNQWKSVTLTSSSTTRNSILR